MSLLIPDSGLLFWMLLIFAIVFVILAKFGFPVITKMIAKRRDHINDSLRLAEEAEVKLGQMKQEHARIIAQAREEQNRILKEAAQERDNIIRQAQRYLTRQRPGLMRKKKAHSGRYAARSHSSRCG